MSHQDFKNIAYAGYFRHFVCVFVFAVVFVIVFVIVFVFVFSYDFWAVLIISFQDTCIVREPVKNVLADFVR